MLIPLLDKLELSKDDRVAVCAHLLRADAPAGDDAGRSLSVAPRSTRRAAPRVDGAGAAWLDTLPQGDLTSDVLITSGLDRRVAQNRLVYYAQTGALERVGRGVYRRRRTPPMAPTSAALSEAEGAATPLG